MTVTQEGEVVADVSEDLTIEEAVDEVESIVDSLEDGDVDLSEAKELRDRADELLNYIETELEVGEGEVERVTPTQ